MEKNTILPVQLDDQGHLILPPELLARYGLVPGAQVRLSEGDAGFVFSRSTENLARVYIEPTNICNLDCATCMRNAWNEPLGKMSAETFERVIKSIGQLTHKPSISFGGFGEPLTHPQILAMVAAAKQVGESVELITNGILLTPEVCEKFIELGLDRLWVSLDGATPQSYADVRLGDALPQVLANLEHLRRQLRKVRSATPRLGIAFVAMKRNIKDLPEILTLGKKLGADLFSISNVLPHTPEMRDEALYVGPHDGDIAVTEWSPLLSLPRMELNEWTRDSLIEALRRASTFSVARQQLNQGANTCPFVEKGSISIRWDGNVAPCLALLHDNENYLDFRKRTTLAFSFGNIREQSLGEIWDSPAYRALRERLLSFDFAYCTSCNGCDLADSNVEDCYDTAAPTCGACLWAQGLIQCP
jgi:MoaA/NifB/PqqE/SkfB family radical SAM enzyme